ncbi:hypothetical protein PHYBOEH_007768 [Phytophthora boehmeriae]|uniref:Transcription factor CBF/NF-Y/archaeal histone domain-containing protein n=1 Tax=Phytophthora boehmeriae TaxID=109152 RepID=A0A8T1W561_9STRA|nr:hypothetical protein PHYBOEH_007768 [Phytophthora boehmeriae]
MAPPAEEGKASAATATAPPAATSTPSTTPHQEATTQTKPPVASSVSATSQKSQATADKSKGPVANTNAKTSDAAAAQALTSSAVSLQLLSQQQEDYRHRLEQLQKKRPAPLTASKTAATDSTVGSSLTTQKTEKKAPATDQKTSAQISNAGSAMSRALKAQEETRRLQFALAQQQVQQYQAMTKQLEAQSGIAMTPSSAGATGAGAAPKTPEEFQKLRQEKLERMQQSVQKQAALAAQALQKRTNEDWLRNKLLLEQEQLRLLRLHEQQLKQVGRGQNVTSATATNIADSLLAQQQQVLRQQQLLRDMLQKQQQQQQADIQRQLQQAGSRILANVQSTAGAKPPVTGTITTAPAVVKRKAKTPLETQMEALARLALRLTTAKNDFEMRLALDKMTSWLHRCTQLPLLQIAQRDFREIMAKRRPLLVKANQWPMDLQVKSEYITQKIVQLVGVFMLRDKNKTTVTQTSTSTAANTAVALTPSTTVANTTAGNTGVKQPTVSSSPSPAGAGAAPSSAQTLPTPQPAVAPTLSAAAATTVAPTDNSNAVKPTMASIERDYSAMKIQMQVKQNDLQLTKEKREAAVKVSTSTITATNKRPLQVQIPGSLKKPRTDQGPITATAAKPRASAPPISPRVAQQFYDLDLSTRESKDTDDKMYLPTKVISKIMEKALPGAYLSGAKAATSTSSSAIVKHVDLGKGKLSTSQAAVPSTTGRPSSSMALNQDPIQISDDALMFMQECVTEFLLYFTSEARDISVLENRRTKKGIGISISGTNILEGMDNLGFASYARVLAIYNEKIKIMQETTAQKKWERKKEIKQRALQQTSAAAAAAIAARGRPAGVLPNPVAAPPRLNYGVKPAAVTSLGRPAVGSGVPSRGSIGLKGTSAPNGTSTTMRPAMGATVARPVVSATTPLASKTAPTTAARAQATTSAPVMATKTVSPVTTTYATTKSAPPAPALKVAAATTVPGKTTPVSAATAKTPTTT